MTAKQIIWSEIDTYFRKNKLNIDNEIEKIEKLNPNNNQVKSLIFAYIVKSLTAYLETKLVIPPKQIFIERSIIAIYLLRSDSPPLQTNIRIDAGFTANNQVKEIREHLGIPLPPQEHEKLFDDSVKNIRECKKCRKILSYDKFSVRKEGKLRWECNGCRKITNMINTWRKKIQVAIFITLKVKDGRETDIILDLMNHNQTTNIQIRCFNCETGLDLLPALQFHHTDKRLKIRGAGWSDLRFKPLKLIIRELDKQDCILLCGNCHAMRTASFFKQYKNVIFSEEIEGFDWKVKGKIKRWIRKKK